MREPRSTRPSVPVTTIRTVNFPLGRPRRSTIAACLRLRNALRLKFRTRLPLSATVALAIVKPARSRMWILKCLRLAQRRVEGSLTTALAVPNNGGGATVPRGVGVGVGVMRATGVGVAVGETVAIGVAVGVGVGVGFGSIVRCPNSSLPQHTTRSSNVTAHACRPPVLTCRNVPAGAARLPLLVVAPAGEPVVAADGAREPRAGTDLLERPGRGVGLPVLVGAPARERVVEPDTTGVRRA